MTISELEEHKILPFDTDDTKIIKLFSFFLHAAPTIDSKSAAKIDEHRLNRNWTEYIQQWDNKQYRFLSHSASIDRSIKLYGLDPESEIKRRTKGFVCKRKTKDESDCQCFLRHIRNSIAHGSVYMKNGGNRKYILFKDSKGAVILLSQSDLSLLKRVIMK